MIPNKRFVFPSVFVVASLMSVSCNAASQDMKLIKLENQLNNLQIQVAQLKQEIHYKKSHKKAKVQKQASNHLRTKHTSNNAFIVMSNKFSDEGGPGSLFFTSYVNRNVDLLNFRKSSDALPARLVIGGKISAEARYVAPYNGNSEKHFNLSDADLAAFAKVSPDVSGFMKIEYDDSAANTPRRISNSNVKIDDAFLTLGNFKKSPFYLTAGQVYDPFGQYDPYLINSTLTYFLGETKSRAFILGYASQAKQCLRPYASAYIYKGDAFHHTHVSYGGDLGFKFNKHATKGRLGVSYTNNIANSMGIQNTDMGANRFSGFDASNSEDLSREPNAVSVYGNVQYKKLELRTDYISTIQSFSRKDLTFNKHGAKPKAFNVEGVYTFHAFRNRETQLIASYSRSYEMLGLNVPEQRVLASFAVEVFKHTWAQLEYRHDINYGKSDSAMGRVLTPTGKKLMSAFVMKNLGKTDNGVDVQVSAYF